MNGFRALRRAVSRGHVGRGITALSFIGGATMVTAGTGISLALAADNRTPTLSSSQKTIESVVIPTVAEVLPSTPNKQEETVSSATSSSQQDEGKPQNSTLDFEQDVSEMLILPPSEIADKHQAGLDMLRCEQFKEHALQRRRTMFLLHNLGVVGCPIENPARFVQCAPCSKFVSGAIAMNFKSNNAKIIMCSNYLQNEEVFDNALAHELVHAYDLCRVDFQGTPEEIACMEVRAPILSGECEYSREFSRHKVSLWFFNHMEKCVRRRATDSMIATGACGDREECGALVDKVYPRCSADLAPFYTVPRF